MSKNKNIMSVFLKLQKPLILGCAFIFTGCVTTGDRHTAVSGAAGGER